MTCKKLSIDPTFADKLKAVVPEEIPDDMISILNQHFTSLNEWDPSNAGKVLPINEVICKWVTAIEAYYTQVTVSI